MNWVIALLHMVGCENVGHASKLVEQAVFESEERCRSHNRCLWEYASNYFLASTLFEKMSAFEKRLIRVALTFVLKKSDGDLGSALYDETWMNRSTSYLATASAILSAPSTCTSSRSKFLKPSAHVRAFLILLERTWWGTCGQRDCIRHRNA